MCVTSAEYTTMVFLAPASKGVTQREPSFPISVARPLMSGDPVKVHQTSVPNVEQEAEFAV